MKSAFFSLIVLASMLGSASATRAQVVARPPHSVTSADSSKVYTYVAKMPVYLGGLAALSTDLRREFQVASAATGCPIPASKVFVRLIVGPSGYIYAAHSVNAGAYDKPTSLPALPAACEAAVAVAARRLPRLQPGRQNNKPVTVELTIKLLDGSK